MDVRTSTPTPSQPAAVSRIGQRRQVVIPKRLFDALHLHEGDFVEVTAEQGRLQLRPKRLVDVDEIRTKSEAAKVRRGEEQLRAGRSRPWRALKNDLGR